MLLNMLNSLKMKLLKSVHCVLINQLSDKLCLTIRTTEGLAFQNKVKKNIRNGKVGRKKHFFIFKFQCDI